MVKQNSYTVEDAMKVGTTSRVCPHYPLNRNGQCIEVEFFPSKLCNDTLGDIGLGNFRDYAYIGDYNRNIGQEVCPVESKKDILVYVPQKYYFPVELCRLSAIRKQGAKNQWNMVCKVHDEETYFRLPFTVQGKIVPKYDANNNMIGLRFSSGKAPIYKTKPKKVVASPTVNAQATSQTQQPSTVSAQSQSQMQL